MRYLVKARVKPGAAAELLEAVEQGTLGASSIAGDEYIHDLRQARLLPEGVATWVETCFCAVPLEEERPYWERYFELLDVRDAHSRRNCRHENGTERWACGDCNCTQALEDRLARRGQPFLVALARGELSAPSPRTP